MRVALYGNLVADSVYRLDGSVRLGNPNDCSQHYWAAGGIANVARGLLECFPGTKVACSSIVGQDIGGGQCQQQLVEMGADIEEVTENIAAPTSSATVLLTPHSKTSIVAWGADQHTRQFPHIEADWHHIAYLDALPNLLPSELDSFDGILSADLCRTQHDSEFQFRIFDYIGHLDYLLISDGEAMSLVDVETPKEACARLGSLAKGWAVVHHEAGSYWSNGAVCGEHSAPKLHNVNVLGAGDYFSAGFIGCNGEGLEIGDRIKRAHEVATRMLQHD